MSLSLDASLDLRLEVVERNSGAWVKGKWVLNAPPERVPCLVVCFKDREGYDFDRCELPLSELKKALNELD